MLVTFYNGLKSNACKPKQPERKWLSMLVTFDNGLKFIAFNPEQ